MSILWHYGKAIGNKEKLVKEKIPLKRVNPQSEILITVLKFREEIMATHEIQLILVMFCFILL